LSLAEPRPRSILGDWVDRSILDGLSEARSKGTPILQVSARTLDLGLPFGVLDSSVEDVHFFAGRDKAVLGLGVARAFEPGFPMPEGGVAGAESMMTGDASKVVLMGGWGFSPSRRRIEKGVWRGFPRSRWVIPALTFTAIGGETQVVLAAYATPSSKAAPMRARYRSLVKEVDARPFGKAEGRGDGTSALPALSSAKSVPSERRWLSLAEDAITSISKNKLKKVVLSRAVELSFHGKIAPSTALKRLFILNPDSTVFAVKRKEAVFLGASPENLVTVTKGEVEVDCLASSAPRGRDVATDEALGLRLLEDPKSSREHQFVVRAAVSALSPISSRIEVPGAPVLKKLTTIQHLYTPVKATLIPGKDVWSAAQALWPSPAIGGEPRDKAVRWIRKFEALERGWYSGVVGIMNLRQDEARLVVGIRSGVVRGKRAVLYAGAGIVAGSEPEAELEETSWKLKTMERALGVDADGGA
jgi:isochorismate synthase